MIDRKSTHQQTGAPFSEQLCQHVTHGSQSFPQRNDPKGIISQFAVSDIES